MTAISLPVFMWRRHRDRFSLARHVLIPLAAALSLIVPFAELFKPGQPSPYGAFPFIAVAVLIAAFAISWIVVARNPATGAGEGSGFPDS